MSNTDIHKWRFRRAGGLDQVSLESGADIANLHKLDLKLWVALACPVKGLEFDERTLALLDSDKDGRVRRAEILEACALLQTHLVSLDPVIRRVDGVKLTDLRTDNADGRAAREAAKLILTKHGKPDADTVMFADVADPAKQLFEGSKLNGDGIITPETADTADLAGIIKDIVATQGGVTDRNGKPGADKDRIDAFFTDLAPFAEWAAKGDSATLSTLGTDAAAIKALRIGIDERFAKGLVTEAEWNATVVRITAHEGWVAAKPGTKVTALGGGRAREILALDGEARVRALLAADLSKEAETKYIDIVEKLVRLQRDFRLLLENFVSFADFYDGDGRTIFQPGRLFLDSRECLLCIRVEDTAKHAAMAGLAKCYLTYCDLSRKDAKDGPQKMQVCAVFSQGDSDFLMVGRNGLFVDNLGRDWDANITKIIANPISIREAFWAPYKKLIRLIEEQVVKRAAAADAEANTKLTSGAETVANADKVTKPAPAPKEAKKVDLGTIALISTTITGLVTIFGLILAQWISMKIYMPLGLLGLILAISGPSMLIAAMKLRQRNLGPILDANGWAMNGRVLVNIPLGTSLTKIAALPENRETVLKADRFAQKANKWPKFFAILATVLYFLFLAWHADFFNFAPIPRAIWHKPAPETAEEKAAREKKEAEAAAAKPAAAAPATPAA
jgi:hypothetical protein